MVYDGVQRVVIKRIREEMGIRALVCDYIQNDGLLRLVSSGYELVLQN